MNRLALRRKPEQQRYVSLASMAEQAFTAGGISYFGNPRMSMSPKKVDMPDGSFEQMVTYVHQCHGVIAAAVLARGLLLSQLRFQWRSVISSENGKLFGTPELGLLEHPNSEQTRPELLILAEHHISYAGNAFFAMDEGQIRLLNPGWVNIALGSNEDPKSAELAADAYVIGYVYWPGGPNSNLTPRYFPAEDVAHWRPEPDPVFWWKGQSWVTSILTEWGVDKAAWTHTQAFFENAATPQMVFSLDPTVTAEQLKAFKDIVESGHAGPANAYKNLFLGGGADAKVVGSDLQRLDLKNLQGLTETRIAVRARIPAAILGVSEGLQGSALNGSSYTQTRRTWSDTWFTPTAQGLCACLEKLVPPPLTAELSYDPAQVMFLQDDRTDEADIQQKTAITIRQLVDAGFDPQTIVAAVTSGDFRGLTHSGLFSVQLQPPTSQQAPTTGVLP